MTLSLLRKVCLITTLKSGHYSQLTQSHLCLKSIRQCFTSRHSGRKELSIIYSLPLSIPKESGWVTAKSFVFSFTQSLLILFVSEYKYIISTLKPFVKKNFKSFFYSLSGWELDAFASTPHLRSEIPRSLLHLVCQVGRALLSLSVSLFS